MIRRPPRSTLFPYTNALPICDRTDAAVAPDRVRAPLGGALGEGFGACAVETVAFFVDGGLGHDGKPRGGLARGQECLVQLFQVTEGFKHDQIDAAFHQRGNLLAEPRARLFTGCLAERFDAYAERADRP